MADSCKNLSQIKLNIKKIFGNLQHLNSYEGQGDDLNKLKSDTEYLLSKLENSPLESIESKRKRRQRKRLNRNFEKINNREGETNKQRLIDEEPSGLVTSKISREPKKKSERCTKSIKESKRFLQTFELLERLHLLRSHNSSETYKFALKLRQVKSIWNCLLQDKLQEQTSVDEIIKQQWNEVLFGQPEKTFFHEKINLHDFIRKRQVWDSYIDSKYGSSIPVGWVIPQSETHEKWRQYLYR